MHYVIAFLILVCFFCSISLVNADIFNNEQGLVAYYSFDEGEGNITLDMSGNCNDGVIYGATWTSGKYNKALLFNGSNYVDYGNSRSLELTEAGTIEVWVKIYYVNTFWHIMGRGALAGWDTNGYSIWYHKDRGKIMGTITDRSDQNIHNSISFGKPSAGTWHHFAFAWDGTYLYAYLDGDQISKIKQTIKAGMTNTSFLVGKTDTSNIFFNGTIDEVKIYNRALTNVEIKAEYDYQFKYNSLKSKNSNCTNNSECKTNNCFKGLCKDMRYCENHSDCFSCHYCDIKNNKCRPLKEIGVQCLDDVECKTKICAEGICKKERDEKRGEANLPRPENKTSKGKLYINEVNKTKVECNFDFDCLPAKYCDKDNKCKNLKDENFACSKDTECKTNNCYWGICKDDGYVAIWNFIIGTFMLVFTVLIFFLPGFVLTLIKKRIPMSERIPISIGLSLALNILGIFVLNKFFGVPINFLTIFIYAFSFVTFGALFYYFKNEKHIKSENFKFKELIKEYLNNIKNDRLKILNLSILLFVLLFTFFLQYGIHSDYDFPFHTDEWQHLARAVQIIDTQTIPDVDPYYNKYPIGEMDLEIGFHVFLAEFYILSNQDPVLFYKFLPAIFSMLAGLMIFLLVRKITKNFYAGILSVLFFTSLKSTIGILGIWFFVPLSMDFMFIFLFFYLYLEGMRRNSAIFLFFSVLIISTIALIHPQSASWIYPVIILYLLLFAIRNILKINLTNILKFKNAIFGNILLFSLPFLSFIYFFKILWKGSFEATMDFFLKEFIVFRGCPAERGICEPNFIPTFYGTVAFILAVVGLAYLIYKFIKNNGDAKFNSLLPLAWIFGLMFLISTLYIEPIGKAVASLMGIQYSPFTLLTGSIRLFYETFLCLTVLSGIGLYAIIKFIYVRIKKTNFNQRQKGIAFILITLVTGIIIFASVFTGYYDLKPKIYKDIDNDDYKAIKWIEKNFGQYNIIFARSHISETIYPISKNYVVAITPHAKIPTTGERNSDVYSFFMGDCNTKRKILEKYNASFVIEKYPIKCDFLEEIYNKGVYVYRVEKN